jgi:histidyl-tRNA synthetase
VSKGWGKFEIRNQKSEKFDAATDRVIESNSNRRAKSFEFLISNFEFFIVSNFEFPPTLSLPMQLLPGFRDFYPEDCARRNYIVATWREVARRYGFVEYDGPLLEPVDLYKKKSGGELLGQLFDFTDKGERHVSIRPEMTPTLARMVIARERDYKKPLRWFSAAQFFRYEKQQKGRLREFYQLNCDIIGESSIAADAEMLALTIDILRAFGLTESDFVLRVSDREAWLAFLRAKGVDDSRAGDFLPIIDKLERDDPAATAAKLHAFGLTIEEVRDFIANPAGHFDKFNALAADLDARGMAPFYQLDPTIVRGLAYYTGVVFEVFDRARTLRAIAGGGRYDNLISVMSDGRLSLPAFGFGMGDVTLAQLIELSPAATGRMAAAMAREAAADLYVVIAKEALRPQALALIQQLRDRGFRLDFPLAPAKVGKQFQAAEQAGARLALLVGDEWPQVKVKTLATREETLIPFEQIPPRVQSLLTPI